MSASHHINNQKCPASTEIVSAILLHQLNKSEMLDFLVAPIEFMRNHCNVDIPSAFSMRIVVNTDEEISLALPYYSHLETMQSEEIADENLAIIVGGEVMTSAPASLEQGGSIIEISELLTFASLGRTITRNLPTLLIKCSDIDFDF